MTALFHFILMTDLISLPVQHWFCRQTGQPASLVSHLSY